MNDIFKQIIALVSKGEVRISEHGYDELADDNLYVREIVQGLSAAIVIEEYPDYAKGPCVLVLQKDRNGEAIHVVWGIAKNTQSPAVMVTAYRPDPEKWIDHLVRRTE
ncbi:MAG: hypothetical protein A4S08_05805 [Proteobacteria bacterium SG_bin4]|nr:MAG: hypothetical protein A4S08_05805 [Proteobacteria bacterium SG_bin4]